MIKNPAILEAFEQKEIARKRADPVENMRIFNELYQFAMKTGTFSRSDPLEGIETKIEGRKLFRRLAEKGR
jgi:hypothetical protein